jgi:hypothetical protein
MARTASMGFLTTVQTTHFQAALAKQPAPNAIQTRYRSSPKRIVHAKQDYTAIRLEECATTALQAITVPLSGRYTILQITAIRDDMRYQKALHALTVRSEPSPRQ